MSFLSRLLAGLFHHIRQPLYVNTLYILGTNVFPGLAGAVFWAIAARIYSAADVGYAAAIISIMTLMSSLAGLGTNIGLIRFLPESADPVKFTNAIYTINFISSLITGLIYFVGIPFWTPSFLPIRINAVYTFLFFVFMFASTLGTAILYTFVARQNSKYAFLHTVITNSARLFFIIALFRLGAQGIVSSVTFAFTISILVMSFGFLPRVIPNYRPHWVWNWESYKVVIPYSIGNFIVSILAQTPMTFIPLLIVEILGPIANGYAYIPLMFTSMITVIGFSLATAAFAEGSNNLNKSGEILTRSTVGGLVISMLITALTYIGAPWLLAVFGPDYAIEGITLMRWAVFSGPFLVLNQNYYVILRLEKKVTKLVLLSATSLVITLSITSYYLPYWGIKASGIGILMGNMTVSAIILWSTFKDRIFRKGKLFVVHEST